MRAAARLLCFHTLSGRLDEYRTETSRQHLSELARAAMGLCETDTLLAVAKAPSSSDEKTWELLLQSSAYSQTESHSVLQLTSLPTSEVLYASGGAVPLMVRKKQSDGASTVSILQQMVEMGVTASPALSAAAVDSFVSNALSLKRNAIDQICVTLAAYASIDDVLSAVLGILTAWESAPRADETAVLLKSLLNFGMAHRQGFDVVTMVRIVRIFLRFYKLASNVTGPLEELAASFSRALDAMVQQAMPDDVRDVRVLNTVVMLRCIRLERLEAFDEFFVKVTSPHNCEDHHEVLLEMASASLSSTPIDPRRVLPQLTRLAEMRPTDGAASDDWPPAYNEIHRRAIAELVGLGESHLNDAYLIVVTHKHHGLKVTVDVIRPLLRAMCERGDTRCFTLTDMATQYSQSRLDMEAVGCLFRCCEVANDHHRAKALLSLVMSSIPGYLTIAAPSVLASLRALRVVRPPVEIFGTFPQ